MLISPSTRLWEAARTSLLFRGRELFDCWGTVSHKFDLEDIHDLRVASRRLREALLLYAPCYPEKSVSRLTGRIKKLTAMLGEIRNTDEALLFLDGLPSTLPGPVSQAVLSLTKELQLERTEEEHRLRCALNKIKPSELRRRFEKLCNNPAIFGMSGHDPFMNVSDFLKGTLHERERSLLRFVPDAAHEENISAQHRLRIAVKHFRYRLELAALFLPERLNGLIAVAKRYQELLGTLHDLDVFAAMSGERIPSPEASEPLLAHIADLRHTLFEKFVGQSAAYPLEKLASDARSLL